MSLHAFVSYTDASSIDSAGTRNECWRASIKLREPYLGLSLSQTYQQVQNPRLTAQPLTDSLTVTGATLEEAQARAIDAIELLTGIAPLPSRSVDLRHLHASPALLEEFKVAKDARKKAA